MGRDKREHQRKIGQRNEQRSRAIQSGVDEANSVLESWEKIYGTVSQGKMPQKQMDALRRNFVATVPIEMHKGIKKFIAEGKVVTVDSLLEEAKTTPGFLPVCAKLGLGLPWFEDRARVAIEEYELKHGTKVDRQIVGDGSNAGGNSISQPTSVFGKISQLFRHRQ